MRAAIELLRPFLGWVCLALLLALGAQTLRLSHAQADLALERQGRAVDAREHALAAERASEAYRAEEARRNESLQEISHVAALANARALDDRRAADRAAAGLRERFAAVAASRCGATQDPAAASSGPPAPAAADLLTEVQRRIDEAAGELADFADRAYIAGLACQRSYEALTPPR